MLTLLHLPSQEGFGFYKPKEEAEAAAATPPMRAGARDIPCVPPPEGWEAAGEAAEEGTAAAVTLNEEPGGPYFDASETLPLPADELITAGAPIPKAHPTCMQRSASSFAFSLLHLQHRLNAGCLRRFAQDSITGVVSPAADEAKPEHTHHVSLGAVTDAVVHAAERAAAALRQASEDGTRGTP